MGEKTPSKQNFIRLIYIFGVILKMKKKQQKTKKTKHHFILIFNSQSVSNFSEFTLIKFIDANDFKPFRGAGSFV